MVTTGLFFGLGDIIAQSLFPHTVTTTTTDKDGNQVESVKVSDYTPERTVRAMIYGSVFFAPISVLWHGKTLPRLKNPFISMVKRKMMETKSRRRLHFYDTVFRLGVDQLIFPGLVWIPLYNTVMVILAQHEDPFGVIRHKLENNWWTVLQANWTVWPGFQLVNLYFIPVHLRIVCANVWSTGWSTFLSFVHNTRGHGKGSGKKLEELVDIEDDDQEVVMVSPDQPYDLVRTLRAVVYGGIIFAPLGDKWYKVLNTKIVWRGKNERTMSTILRVAVDQLVFAPFIGIPLYYGAMTVLENRKPYMENIMSKFETSWWVTLKSNWLVWPIFQWFNFYLLPVEYRLLAVNLISIGWNTYLSYVMHNKS
ncbi:SYM1 [Candida metapsilosis]|uniref:Protein SYM1 n=1 Tax=Candida metapsilosis TaxID=273372 RepID=A0A8H7ZLB3_9ASCO|nr:SYM1 [Candida metapsilosis]